MVDKAAIELGQRLKRLLAHEDFAPLLAEWDGRVATLKAQQEACSSVYDSPPHIAAHIAQRLNETAYLREWIEDTVARGGREFLKQQAEAAQAVEEVSA